MNNKCLYCIIFITIFLYFGCGNKSNSFISVSLINVLPMPVSVNIDGNDVKVDPYQNYIYEIPFESDFQIKYKNNIYLIGKDDVSNNIIIGDKIQVESGFYSSDDYSKHMYDLINNNQIYTYACDVDIIEKNMNIYLEYLNGLELNINIDLLRYYAIPCLVKPITAGLYREEIEVAEKICLDQIEKMLRYNDYSESNRTNHQAYAIKRNYIDNGFPPKGISYSTYNIETILNYYSIRIEDSPMYEEFMLRFLEEELSVDRKYDRKEEFMIKIAGMLTGENEVKGRNLLNKYAKDEIAEEDAIQIYAKRILNIPLINCSKENAGVVLEGDNDILFKFTFEGCKACVDEEEYEASLLERNEKITLVNIYYSTGFDYFTGRCNVIEEHNIKNYLLNPESEIDVLAKLNGRIGAPLYSLYDQDEKIFRCIDCPKPSGSLIDKYFN